MTRILRPSDSLRIPNLLTRIPVGKGQILYSPPDPGPAFGALPFQVQVNQIGQVTCDFNPQGIVVTNPYGFYIYFPDAETWAPEFYGNFIVPYAPSPGAIIRFNSSKDPFGNPQVAGPQIGGPASCIITTDLSQYTGGGALGVTSGVPYINLVIVTSIFPSAPQATGWGQAIPYPNNSVIITSGSLSQVGDVYIGTSPTNVQLIARIPVASGVNIAPIRLPYGWDIYLGWASGSATPNMTIAAY